MGSLCTPRLTALALILLAPVACEKPKGDNTAAPPASAATTASAAPSASAEEYYPLHEIRADHKTKLTKKGSPPEPVDVPPKGSGFDLIKYKSAVGDLQAYVTIDPKDGKRHPAIVWITGGDRSSCALSARLASFLLAL